jgi:hypothetical protein
MDVLTQERQNKNIGLEKQRRLWVTGNRVWIEKEKNCYRNVILPEFGDDTRRDCTIYKRNVRGMPNQ